MEVSIKLKGLDGTDYSDIESLFASMEYNNSYIVLTFMNENFTIFKNIEKLKNVDHLKIEYSLAGVVMHSDEFHISYASYYYDVSYKQANDDFKVAVRFLNFTH